MGDYKVAALVIKVDLECHRCNKKIRKVLCKLQEKENITSIVYDDKSNTVTLSGRFDPERISKKLYHNACNVVKDIQIKDDKKEEKTKETKPTGAGEGIKKPTAASSALAAALAGKTSEGDDAKPKIPSKTEEKSKDEKGAAKTSEKSKDEKAGATKEDKTKETLKSKEDKPILPTKEGVSKAKDLDKPTKDEKLPSKDLDKPTKEASSKAKDDKPKDEAAKAGGGGGTKTAAPKQPEHPHSGGGGGEITPYVPFPAPYPHYPQYPQYPPVQYSPAQYPPWPVGPNCCSRPWYDGYYFGARCGSCGRTTGWVSGGPPFDGPPRACQFFCEEDNSCAIM